MLTTEVILTCLLIFFARIGDVTLMSIRTILLTKGMSKIAAFFGFFEVLIFITVLGKVVSSLDNPLYLLSYAFGFSTGNLLGSKIERSLALGDAQMRVILSDEYKSVIRALREKDFGVTVFTGTGKNGQKLMLLINLQRKRIPEVYKYLKENDIKAFVSTNDITSHNGGYHRPPQRIQMLRLLRR